jgi:hypothetical protein
MTKKYYQCKGRKYKVLKKDSHLFGQTLKEFSRWNVQGVIVGVCFEALFKGEWHSFSFLFQELELIEDKKEEARKQRYDDVFNDEHGETMHYTEEEKDLIQKHAN